MLWVQQVIQKVLMVPVTGSP